MEFFNLRKLQKYRTFKAHATISICYLNPQRRVVKDLKTVTQNQKRLDRFNHRLQKAKIGTENLI